MMPSQPVSFYSEGVILRGDLFLPDDIAANERRPGIVLCHGYTGVRSLYLPDNARVLTEAGYVVLTFDYKGWGDSDGPKSRLSPYGRVIDSQAALTFLGAQSGVDPDRLGLYGTSYGGATVVWTAAIDPRAYPDMVRRIKASGHTIGTHSYSHPFTFKRMSIDKAQFEINEGIASVAWALGDGSQPAPFFRIPGLLRADYVEHYLASQHLQVWSADFPADDWTKISPAQVYQRAIQRIEANHKGILLLHDIQPRTVEALPFILQDLKRRGFHIVHVVPATPELPKTVTAAADWIVHGSHIWPQTPVFAETDPELPVPSPASRRRGSRAGSRGGWCSRASRSRPRSFMAYASASATSRAARCSSG